MRALLVIVVVLGACKYRFDDVVDARATSDADFDAVAAHDEDGDGFADSEDFCPHQFDVAQIDNDGDRVGDGCDVEPMNARQSLVFFDPMLTDDNWTIVTATWTELGDALGCDGTPVFCEIDRPLAFQYGTIYVGIDITARNPSVAQHQVAVAPFFDRTTPYHYAEVWENPATPPGYAAVSRFTGTTFATVGTTPLATNVRLGRLTMVLQPYEPGPMLVTGALWPGEPYTVNVQDATYAGGSTLSIGAQGVVFELAYVVVIATN